MQEDPKDNSGQFAFDASAGYNYNPQQVFVPAQQPMYQQQQFSGAPMNTPVFQQQAPGHVGNPFFLPQGGLTQPVGMYNPYTQQAFYYQPQQVPQDKVVHVDGFNPYGSKGLLPEGIESTCEQLQLDMLLAQEKVIAEREKRIQGYYVNNGFYNNSYNYYGMPYMNTMDQSVYNNYIGQLREIANTAIQTRIDFNKNISRLVHKFVGDEVSEEDIDRIYEGYTYTIPGATIQNYEIQDKLYKCVPVDNSRYYQEQFNNITKMYKSLTPDTGDLNEFLANCGFLIMEDKLEDHIHRMRDASRLYTPDTFRMYLRRYALENNIKNKQEEVKQEVKSGNLSNLPSNQEEATRLLLGDAVARDMAAFRQRIESGVVPIGPQNQYGTPVVMTDELENEFELRRGAFINSIYNNPNHAQTNLMKGVT